MAQCWTMDHACRALFYGANAAVVAAVLQKFPHVFGIAAMIFLGSFLMNLPMAIRDLRGFQFSRRHLFVLLGMIVMNFTQDILTLIGFTLGPSPYVIAIKRTSILLAAAIGYVFLHERGQSLPRLLLATGCVVLGIILVVLQ